MMALMALLPFLSCLILLILNVQCANNFTCSNLPQGFQCVRELDLGMIEEIRYSTYHNFMGHPVLNYNSNTCVLTVAAAKALIPVQRRLLSAGYTIKFYDCYRPQSSVNSFVAWAKNYSDILMKEEFYPELNKSQLFPEYIAYHSGHSRGSTSDLTIVPLPIPSEEQYHRGQQLIPCYDSDRFKDNSIDMGTGFDCFSPLAHTNATVSPAQQKNRQWLVEVMAQGGFTNYVDEWW
jgi:D-alanyl-D-alanine dipeptidase